MLLYFLFSVWLLVLKQLWWTWNTQKYNGFLTEDHHPIIDPSKSQTSGWKCFSSCVGGCCSSWERASCLKLQLCFCFFASKTLSVSWSTCTFNGMCDIEHELHVHGSLWHTCTLPMDDRDQSAVHLIHVALWEKTAFGASLVLHLRKNSKEIFKRL